jgi:hypothetical protein
MPVTDRSGSQQVKQELCSEIQTARFFAAGLKSCLARLLKVRKILISSGSEEDCFITAEAAFFALRACREYSLDILAMWL